MKMFNENLKLSDLTSRKGTSAFTSDFQDEREELVGKESALASCDAAGLGENGEDVIFKFTTPGTFGGGGTVNAKTFQKSDNPSGVYELWILVLDFIPALLALKGSDEVKEEPEEDVEPEEVEDNSEVNTEVNTEEEKPLKEATVKITKEDIADIMDLCDIQLWSNDASFYFQGLAYNLTQMGACIYPVNIKPKRWNKVHGDDGYVNKHMSGLLDSLPKFYNNMAQQVTSLFRKKGISI